MNTLDIDAGRLAIDIHTQYARLEISNNLSRKMRIKVARPQMVVQRRPPTFKVERNAGSPLTLNNTVHLKKLVLHKNVQKTHLIGTGGSKSNNSLDELSYSIQTEQPVYSVELQDSRGQNSAQTIQYSASGSQNIVWDPGYFKVDWESGGIEIEWDENTKPDIQVSPYSVEISVKGRNVVHIAVIEDRVPGQKGQKINKRV